MCSFIECAAELSSIFVNIVEDKLKNAPGVIFSESACTINRVVRFTTPFWRTVFAPVTKNGGKWDTGDYVMYEICLEGDNCIARCAVATDEFPEEYAENRAKLFGAFPPVVIGGVGVFSEWQLSEYANDNDAFLGQFDSFLGVTVHEFEKSVKEKTKDISEGEEKTVSSARYERNPLARKICLEYHGTACKVCSMDFGKEYGPEFAGKIEVHHIVPISSIGKDYIVDPVKDLVPVCPNCHTALHSKKDGVYTVDELKRFISGGL